MDDDDVQVINTMGWILVGYFLGILVCGIILKLG